MTKASLSAQPIKWFSSPCPGTGRPHARSRRVHSVAHAAAGPVVPASQPRTRRGCLPAAETHARGSRVREEVSLSVSQNVAVCLPEPGVLGDEGAGAGAGGEEKEEEKEEVLCAGQRRMS